MSKDKSISELSSTNTLSNDDLFAVSTTKINSKYSLTKKITFEDLAKLIKEKIQYDIIDKTKESLKIPDDIDKASQENLNLHDLAHQDGITEDLIWKSLYDKTNLSAISISTINYNFKYVDDNIENMLTDINALCARHIFNIDLGERISAENVIHGELMLSNYADLNLSALAHSDIIDLGNNARDKKGSGTTGNLSISYLAGLDEKLLEEFDDHYLEIRERTDLSNSFSTLSGSNKDETVIHINPYIENNITGSGNNNYIAQFNGKNSITELAEIDTSKKSSDKFLSKNGTWENYSSLKIPTATENTNGLMTTALVTKLNKLLNYELSNADSNNLGGIKVGYPTDPSNRNYGIQLTTEGKAYVNVPWTDSIYSLLPASNSTLGGIKIGFQQSGKNYPVLLSNDQAYVNVPWSNTTYTAGDGITITNNVIATSKQQLIYLIVSSIPENPQEGVLYLFS